MTRTYFTKTVISPRNIVVTTQIMGEEHMSVISRGLSEDQDLGAAIIEHKQAADIKFATSSETQILQRQAYNRKQTITLADRIPPPVITPGT